MNLTRLFELIEDDELITVKWDGFPDFEHQGRKDDYFYQDDDIVVVSLSSSKEEGLIIVVAVK